MKRKLKNCAKIFLMAVLAMGMVVQAFQGLNFTAKAAEEKEYEELTFREWGIVNGAYSADYTHKLTVSGRDSLDGAAFTGIINFNGNSGGGHALRIGANYGEWYSLMIYYRLSDNTLIFSDQTNGGGGKAYGAWLGEGWNSKDIKLRLTFDYDAANTAWNIGIWINDEYKTTYAFTNMNLVGTCLMINGTVTLKDTRYKIPTDYTTYTHADFNIPSGTYAAANGTAAASGSVKGIENFNKTVLHFPGIKFEGDVDLNFAGVSCWAGFKLRSVSKTGELQLSSGYGQFITSPVSMTDDIAGVDVVGGSYDLKITILYTNDTTIKMGIWFNDVLYDNKYITVDVSEKANDKLGLYMGITSTTGGGTITLEATQKEYVKTALYEDISTYRTGTKSAPTLEGYLFAGWYTDEDCTAPLSSETTEGAAYAKFVDNNVLKVKAQITANTTASSETADIRFVTTVDTLQYEKVGFEVTANGRTKTYGSGVVYKQLKAVSSDEVMTTYKPNEEFSPVSTYFKACTITGVPNSAFDWEWTVRPYWITSDGTTVYGETAVKRVSEGIGL